MATRPYFSPGEARKIVRAHARNGRDQSLTRARNIRLRLSVALALAGALIATPVAGSAAGGSAPAAIGHQAERSLAQASCNSSSGAGIPAPQGLLTGIDGLHAAWYGQSGYPTLCPGDRSTAVVAFLNTGSIGWISGAAGQTAYLGTWDPEPGQDLPSPLGGDGTHGSPNTGWPAYNRTALQPAAYVGPGQVAWFQFTIQAPRTPGTYRLALRPLVEGTQWLEDYGVFWYVTVVAATARLPAPVLPQAPNCPVLPGDNILNTDISALPVHARSATWLASMGAGSARLHNDFGPYPYGYQIQFVGNDRPTVSIVFAYRDESDPGPYPLGPDTPIEPFPDRHAFLVNKDTCTLYEISDVMWNGGRPTAGSGAIFDLRSNALRPPGWTSADAAGLPMVPLLVRYEEMQAGAIDHAIRFAVQRTDRSYLWPARHQAGIAADPSLPPMGARFRLKGSFDLSLFSPQAQVILRAMQRYGLILSDNTNGRDWFFQGVTDPRWPDSLTAELFTVPTSQFEAIDESSLTADPDSGAARRSTP